MWTSGEVGPVVYKIENQGDTLIKTRVHITILENVVSCMCVCVCVVKFFGSCNKGFPVLVRLFPYFVNCFSYCNIVIRYGYIDYW